MNNKPLVLYDGVMMTKAKAAGQKMIKTKQLKKEKELKKLDKQKNIYNDVRKEEQREMVIKQYFDVYKKWTSKDKEGYLDGINSYFNRCKPGVICLDSEKLLFHNKLTDAILKFNKNKKCNDEMHMPDIYIPNHIEFSAYFPHADRSKDSKEYFLKNYGIEQLPKAENIGHFSSSFVINQSYKNFIKLCDNTLNNYRGNKSWDMSHNPLFKECVFPYKRHSIGLIWADYCGGFSNNIEDIELTFKSKLLGHYSYYIMTFCVRDPKKGKTKYSKTDTIIAINEVVNKYANKYKYIATLQKESGMYKKNMYTVIFLIEVKALSGNEKKIRAIVESIDEMRGMVKRKEATLKVMIDGFIP